MNRIDTQLIDREIVQWILRHSVQNRFMLQQMIADDIGCSDRTIRRAFARLRATGQIETVRGCRRSGYIYRILP